MTCAARAPPLSEDFASSDVVCGEQPPSEEVLVLVPQEFPVFAASAMRPARLLQILVEEDERRRRVRAC
jgi:hypothetical protein